LQRATDTKNFLIYKENEKKSSTFAPMNETNKGFVQRRERGRAKKKMKNPQNFVFTALKFGGFRTN